MKFLSLLFVPAFFFAMAIPINASDAGKPKGVRAGTLRDLAEGGVDDFIKVLGYYSRSGSSSKSSKSKSKSSSCEDETCDFFGICEASDFDGDELCSFYEKCKPSDRVCPSDSMDQECKGLLPDICPSDLKTPCNLEAYTSFCENISDDTACQTNCQETVRNCCPRTPFDSIKERWSDGIFNEDENCPAIVDQALKACENFETLDFCETDLCWALEERACNLCDAMCSYGGPIYRLIDGTVETRRRLTDHDGSPALYGGIDPNDEKLDRHLRNPLTSEEIEDIMTNYKFPEIDDSGLHYVKPNLLTADECGLLMEYLEENRYRSKQHEKRTRLQSAKLYFTPHDLVNIIGKNSTQKVLNTAYEAAGEVRPVLKMWLSQVSNDGQHQEDYHTDWRSERQESTTFMVALNRNEDLISGGELVYLSRNGTITVKRDQGMAYSQSSRVFHGVPAFEGVRRTLFIILVKDMARNPGHLNLIEGTGLV